MKVKNIVIIVSILAVSLIYTWYEANRPKPVDWSETYSPEDKIPYGTYIVYHSLPKLFPASEINTARLSVVEEFARLGKEFTGAWIFVNNRFTFDAVESERLLRWVEKGNQLFIAAEIMPDTLLNKFSLQLQRDLDHEGTRLLFAGDTIKEYSFNRGWGTSYFVLPPDFRGQRLGVRTENEQPDFIRIPYGQGQVYLNLNPAAFTNRGVLHTTYGDYYYKALSWLPDQKQTLTWDAYRTMGRREAHTPLKVILRYPALRLALYLLLATSLCYVLFRIRREQRPIPVIRPPENKMLEFIATIGALYYRQKEHTAIALKQTDFFLGEVRLKYQLHTDRLDEEFVRMLAERSGVDEEETGKLIRLIREIKAGHEVSEKDLRDLMHGTELFIKRLNI